MVLYTRVISMKGNGKAQELKFGLTALSTKASGARIKLMARASFGMQTVIFMKENGLTIRLMDMEFTSTRMVLNTRATGRMICKRAEALKRGATGVNSKVTIRKV